MIVILALVAAFGAAWSVFVLDDVVEALLFMNLSVLLVVLNQVIESGQRQERRFKLFVDELRLRSRR